MEEGDDREEKGASDAQLMSEIQARESEVLNLLKKKDKIRALVASLQNPPVTTKSINVKVLIAAVIVVFQFVDIFMFWGWLTGRECCCCRQGRIHLNRRRMPTSRRRAGSRNLRYFNEILISFYGACGQLSGLT
jgi:hypothetical protein